MGYENVTVFDKNEVPGGMLTLGIPSFRLEKDVVNAEIEVLKEMGVHFQCGVEIGKDLTIDQLREQLSNLQSVVENDCVQRTTRVILRGGSPADLANENNK